MYSPKKMAGRNNNRKINFRMSILHVYIVFLIKSPCIFLQTHSIDSLCTNSGFATRRRYIKLKWNSACCVKNVLCPVSRVSFYCNAMLGQPHSQSLLVYSAIKSNKLITNAFMSLFKRNSNQILCNINIISNKNGVKLSFKIYKKKTACVFSRTER